MTCPVCGEITVEDEKDPSAGRDTRNVPCRYCRYMEIVDLDKAGGLHGAHEDEERS